jgi:hypothetical protein
VRHALARWPSVSGIIGRATCFKQEAPLRQPSRALDITARIKSPLARISVSYLQPDACFDLLCF